VERGKDWTKIFKVHEPTINMPIPKVGAGLMGMEDLFQEVTTRIPELVEPVKFFGVGAVATAGDLIGRQFFESSAGPKTPDGFYQKELLWSVPGLVLGRIISDVVGGPAVLRAFVLGTVANGVIFTAAKDFGFSTFLVREALLVPLSLLIVGRPAGQEAR
jgi:hypothetical protein